MSTKWKKIESIYLFRLLFMFNLNFFLIFISMPAVHNWILLLFKSMRKIIVQNKCNVAVEKSLSQDIWIWPKKITQQK